MYKLTAVLRHRTSHYVHLDATVTKTLVFDTQEKAETAAKSLRDTKNENIVDVWVNYEPLFTDFVTATELLGLLIGRDS